MGAGMKDVSDVLPEFTGIERRFDVRWVIAHKGENVCDNGLFYIY